MTSNLSCKTLTFGVDRSSTAKNIAGGVYASQNLTSASEQSKYKHDSMWLSLKDLIGHGPALAC